MAVAGNERDGVGERDEAVMPKNDDIEAGEAGLDVVERNELRRWVEPCSPPLTAVPFSCINPLPVSKSSGALLRLLRLVSLHRSTTTSLRFWL